MRKNIPRGTIGILAEYPLSLVCGGLEIQCIESYKALHKLNSNIQLINYHNSRTKYSTIHLFGSPASFYELCKLMSSKNKLIISVVLGGQGPSKLRSLSVQLLASMMKVAGQNTDYLRTKYMFERADALLCLNESEKNLLCERYLINPKKVYIVPNGVSSSFYTSSQDEFNKKYKIRDFVLFTGQIVQRKNPLLLASVLSHLNIPGVFIGSMPAGHQLYQQKFLTVIRKSTNLKWIDGLSHDSKLLSSAYRASSIFCLPSVEETQSISILEAIVSNKPILLAEAPYTHQHLFSSIKTFRIDDISDMEAKIIDAFNHPSKYRISQNYDYSWNAVATKISKIYSRLD